MATAVSALFAFTIFLVNRIDWIYRTYFNREEQTGLDLFRPRTSWDEWKVALGLILVSFIGFILTAIYLWSVR